MNIFGKILTDHEMACLQNLICRPMGGQGPRNGGSSGGWRRSSEFRAAETTAKADS